jgi:hypothetical protein
MLVLTHDDTYLQQLVGMRSIQFCSFGLEIRVMWTPFTWALFVLYASPGERIDEHIY